MKGYPYRFPRCFVCSKMAVAVDVETGDSLCVLHYQQRLAIREAVKNLPKIPAEKADLSNEDSLDNKVY